MLLVHSEIYYVPVGDGWEEVLVHNIFHSGHWKGWSLKIETFLGPEMARAKPTPSNAPHNDVAPLKIITYRTIKTTGTLVVIA